jgi:hypothetical protein
MVLVLASYWEPENHGPGRKIGISPSKPRNLMEECGYDCEFVYEALAPDDSTYYNYHEDKHTEDDAGEVFVSEYTDKLNRLVAQVKKTAEDQGKEPNDILGFEDGDTLLSWERGGHLTYRTHTAEALRELGYEVEER